MPGLATSAASMSNGKAQVEVLFPGDLIALQAMDMFPKYSPLLSVQSKNPPEVWGVFLGGWLGTFGPPKCTQMDEGGE